MNALTDTSHPERTLTPTAPTGVVRLMLTDFRNYEHLRLDLEARPVVLTGENGAGKTNVLEALSFLTSGRGMRGAKLADIGRCSPDGTEMRPWAVSADLETAIGSVRLGTGIDPSAPERRSVHIDGKPAKGAAAFAAHCAAVWVTPAMDRLFTDTPGERRRFIDRLVTVLDPDHASRVAAYDQANRRRARLFRDGVSDATWFDAEEDTLARYGVAIAAARHGATARLNGVLATEDGPFPTAQLGLTGQIDEWLDTMAAVDAEEALRQSLAADRAAWTGDGEPPPAQGPNRSDLDVIMSASGRAAADCSTGEQKALLISIILAHVRLQTEQKGQPPLLLLDEVAAHLDRDRRHHLFERIVASGTQAWLTGTDVGTFAELGDWAQIFSVSNRQVTPTPLATVLSHPKIGGQNQQPISAAPAQE